MKEQIKKIIPQSWILGYHYLLAQLSNFVYWFPSRKLRVIGVTGTNGKSTTVNLIAKILEEAGYRVGLISTVNIQVGDQKWLNDLKMTMPGRMKLQNLLRKMVRAGCHYAVIETSSEGILQYRHLGIEYDVAVFTNLTPEHLETHGGFDNYKKTKLKLPALVASLYHKTIGDKRIEKALVANLDDFHAPIFLDFKADQKVGYHLNDDSRRLSPIFKGVKVVNIKNLKISESGIGFQVEGTKFDLHLLGLFDLYNAGSAISVAVSQGIDLQICKKALEKVTGIPGRLEKIEEGQPFTVLVDYSPEPTSLTEVYKTLKHWKQERIIHVLGSAGGGRDVSRRPILGFVAGSNADLVIVTNEDPYDEDPSEIIDHVAEGVKEAGLTEGEQLFKILDRRKAIRKALESAKRGDLVLITGKGSEQAIVVAHGRKIIWDDRKVIREELEKLGYNK